MNATVTAVAVLSLPLLRRLYRRFETWLAPALALGVFAGMFALSSLVIAPRITGGPDKPEPHFDTLYGYSDRGGTGMTEISYTVPDMSCDHCKAM